MHYFSPQELVGYLPRGTVLSDHDITPYPTGVKLDEGIDIASERLLHNSSNFLKMPGIPLDGV
jgi:hypothetical protein